MGPRLAAKMSTPILFAHRGASAVERDNTIAAFELGLRLGANGLESDVWVTSDGHAILDHDGRVGRIPMRRRIGTVELAAVPDHMPSLRALYQAVGADFELSLDVKDPTAIDATVDTLRAVENELQVPIVARTWICHPDFELVRTWRDRWSDLRLVHSTRLHALSDSPEAHGAALFECGIDAINMHHTDWSGGLTTLFHRFGLYAFGWDVQLERVAYELLNIGIDAIYGDHVDRLCAARDRLYDT